MILSQLRMRARQTKNAPLTHLTVIRTDNTLQAKSAEGQLWPIDNDEDLGFEVGHLHLDLVQT